MRFAVRNTRGGLGRLPAIAVGAALLFAPLAALAAPTVATYATGQGGTTRGIAIDSSGGVYVAVGSASKILKPASGASTPGPVFASGVEGLAFDSTGNLYANSGGGVVKINSTGSSSAAFGTGYVYVTNVAVDSSNTVYAVDAGDGNKIKKITSSGTTSTLTSSITSPYGIAVSNSGTLVVGDTGTKIISQVNTSTGATSTYATMTVTPRGMVFSGSTLYVIATDNKIYSISGSGATPQVYADMSSAVSDSVWNIAQNATTGTLYVSYEAGEIASATASPPPPVVVVPVPTLGQWAMAASALSLLCLGGYAVRRRYRIV